ncbi:histidine--tRNA ligase [Pygmaiobacter massiliensis]|uniref:histidine--tRNA ligase n=1 Tax=Pygmaiobacter massiliensis TaxID=1917873 RepID=UPI0028A1BB1B|nr:histidine--tRNA ligase [Pygmaiobacter massiliensis]
MAEKITAQKGTKDILPAESYRWLHVEDVLRKTVSAYGYKEIRLPTFEATELFARGVGDTTDVVGKEMYTFLDKGGRSITLRPEGTSNTVRALLEHGLLGDAMPLKAYYIQSCFRYEKPQSGRLREFHQLGIEMVGAAGADADVQTIAVGDAVLKNVGIRSVRLEINSIGCPHCRPAYHEALKSYFRTHLDALCDTCKDRLDRNPLRILDCKCPTCAEVAKDAPLMREFLCEECKDHFADVKKGLDNLGIQWVENPTIVRGLDYYTKTVFEFVHTGAGAQGTVCGGGRYDGLIEELGGKPTPAVGFGLGIERLLMVMEAEGAKIPADAVPKIYFCDMGGETRMLAQSLAARLRAKGIWAEHDLMGRGLKAQMKYANKLGAEYTAVIGETELAEGKGKLKRMSDGIETEVAYAELESALF